MIRLTILVGFFLLLTCSQEQTVSSSCEGNSQSKNLSCCVKISHIDIPDDPKNPIDDNCDGIDGNQNQAIFVDAFLGSDQALGSKEFPLKSITAGIKKAVSLRKTEVYISTGIYQEKVLLENGISLYGGYSATDGWARSPKYKVFIQNPIPDLGPSIAVEGNGIFMPTTLADVYIQSADAIEFSQSSYGIHCVDCGSFVILRNQILSGSGAHGKNGRDGTNGANGRSAGSSTDPNDPYFHGNLGGISSVGRQGGNAGEGGREGIFEYGQPGQSGAVGTPGGIAGPPCILTERFIKGPKGADGTPGATGSDGSSGIGGHSQGVLSQQNLTPAGYWTSLSGQPGQRGNHGNGGGGGGGSGSCRLDYRGGEIVHGHVGGGGGAGGEAGLGGLPGTGGGGSFGVFAVTSDGLRIQDTFIRSGSGADGGAGGKCGLGGTGGAGQPGCFAGIFYPPNCLFTSWAGNGGQGASGGMGGNGGHGGGGAGGPSFSVWRYRSQIVLQGANLFFFGTPGEGGISLGDRFRSGNAGEAGLSGQINPE